MLKPRYLCASALLLLAVALIPMDGPTIPDGITLPVGVVGHAQALEKRLPDKQDTLELKDVPRVSTALMNTPTSDNEQIAWDFLISHGFSPNQTAGIMGNLQQEHSFNTSDVPGGLGIAQWTGGRRERLIAKGNYLDIRIQLQFLVEELATTESAAGAAIHAAGSIEEATIAFQNKFERCGLCMQDRRIDYAYAISQRH